MENKKKKKNNLLLNSIKTAIYITVLIFLWFFMFQSIFRGIFAFNDMSDPSLIETFDLSKDIIRDPIQVNNKMPYETMEVKGHTLMIQKLAEYDIIGKIEDIQDYSTNMFASRFLSFDSLGGALVNYISPRDLTLTYGKMALNENSQYLITDQDLANRMVMLGYSSEGAKKLGLDYMKSHVSNNHIVTVDSALRQKLMSFKEGDIVRIIGYLVYVKAEDGTVWGPSSMTRDDNGSHSCEIILAEKILKMNSK